MTKSAKIPENCKICNRCKGKGFVRKSMYHKGRNYEYSVRNFLQERGWVVYRSYGSKGILDLIAVKGQIKLGIQVKNRKTGAYLTPKESQELKFVAGALTDPPGTYELNTWSNHKIKPMTFKAPIHIIHAYSLPSVKQIQWRRLDEEKGWIDAEKLIKTGNLD